MKLVMKNSPHSPGILGHSLVQSCAEIHEVLMSLNRKNINECRWKTTTLSQSYVHTWGEPQLSAYNISITVTPAIITHCPPHSIDADLHSASIRVPSISQSNSSMATASCWQKWHSNKYDNYIHTKTPWCISLLQVEGGFHKRCNYHTQCHVNKWPFHVLPFLSTLIVSTNKQINLIF